MSPIESGVIVEVGDDVGRGHREIDADGRLVTPGFVDLHTHYDGQATWDPILAPSVQHGVTTVLMGNCGVGFAPVEADRHDWLISMMEGVEDIPGTALAEGLHWGWRSYPEYLDSLDRKQRTIDVGSQVPHAALRAFVMGDRGADPTAAPDPRGAASAGQARRRGPRRRRDGRVDLAHREPPHQRRRQPRHAAGRRGRADGAGRRCCAIAAAASSSCCLTACRPPTTTSPSASAT